MSNTMFEKEKELKELALSLLTEKRYKHTQGVRETARLMCKRFGGKYAMKKLYVAAGLCETSASNIARAGEMGIELVEIS